MVCVGFNIRECPHKKQKKQLFGSLFWCASVELYFIQNGQEDVWSEVLNRNHTYVMGKKTS